MSIGLFLGVGAQPPQVNSHSDLVVLLRLVWHADESGLVVMTWAELMREAGCSRATLSRCLNHLEDAGLVQRLPAWKLKSSAGATQFQLSHKILAMRLDVEVPAPILEREEQESYTSFTMGEHPDGWRDADPLTAEGMKILLYTTQQDGWAGVAHDALAQAVEAEINARMGWLISRRIRSGVELNRADLISRMWEILRTHTDQILGADNPWGLAATILYRQVAKEDAAILDEIAVDLHEDAQTVGDYEHGSVVGLADLLDGQGAQHTLIHRLVEAGVPQGLAWRATGRMMEIASSSPPSTRISVARADATLARMGLTPGVIGAWMSLIVGTRRGGVASSYLARLAGGGHGVTDDEARRFATITKGFER